MASVLRFALSPDENGKITAPEGLRDFADASPRWSYLEDTSHHYAAEKEEPALVLRRRVDASTYVDFAFADSPTAPGAVELLLVTRAAPGPPLSGEERAELLDSFRTDLQTYLRERPVPLTLHVAREDVNPPSRV